MVYERVGLHNLKDFLSLQISDAQRKLLKTSVCKTFTQSVIWRGYSTLYLFRAEGKAAGYIFLYHNPKRCKYNIGRLAIDMHFQGKGLGREALLWGVEQLERVGAKRVLLSVHPQNATAIKLYQSAGFAFTGGFWGREAVMKRML